MLESASVVIIAMLWRPLGVWYVHCSGLLCHRLVVGCYLRTQLVQAHSVAKLVMFGAIGCCLSKLLLACRL
jgi:hypothetical protein